MSLQYYPHEDFGAKPAGPPEGTGPHRSDYGPIAIINLALAMSGVSLAAGGSTVGALVVLGLIAGFNVVALTGRH